MINHCQIVYNHVNCLNVKKEFVNICRLCIDACPHQAISMYYELNPRHCTECGVCLAVCPSGGFVYRSSAKLFEYIKTTKKVVLSCPQAMQAGYEIPCLGILDRDLWMTLMLYAGEKELTIYTGVCSDCPDKEACRISVQTFKELHEAWKDHPQVKIKVVPDEGNSDIDETISLDAQNKSKSLLKISREKFEAMMAGGVSDEIDPIPKTRQFLEGTWKLREPAIKALPLPVLTVSEGCINCGECSEICPQGALTKKDSKEQLTLIYEPLKCTHCQRCVSICRSKALRMGIRSLSYRLFTGKILLHQGKRRFCLRCGQQVFDFFEPPLCMNCVSNNY
ncbi:hypothetical protein Desaci_2724 [Desulfosporosinus acidiphilus SJ4]|uniref:Ferredoxin n=1 Tax=Desulfosporosinus acidiphilus (strain DSM 22704 / JCM 16185 / SJ4) TaxID=646529 RepID=I4D781_DESAJ|nr:4Fe-4S dicluster domain-containing protein [Desulfosporosinus acidiphilus]AFM41655.1 hypothetical protein Desaci_2724 [Desulfosporosinus acidiphilus SJ4]